MNRPDEKGVSQHAQAVVLIVLLGLLFLALGVIFLPRYLEYMAHRHQREAVDNLKAVYAAESAYYAKEHRYADSFEKLGFMPSGNYTYYLGNSVSGKGETSVYPLPPEIKTWAGDGGFRAVAVSNLDEDPELDTWAVDEKGTVTHVFNDFKRPRIRDFPMEIKGMLKRKR